MASRGGGGKRKMPSRGGGGKRNGAHRINFDATPSDTDDDLDDDHVHSDDEYSDDAGGGRSSPSDGAPIGSGDRDEEDEEEEEQEETVDAKRIRLAREYLTKMERKVGSRSSRSRSRRGGGGGRVDDEEGSGSSSDESSSSSSSDDDDDDDEQHDRVGAALARRRQKHEGTLTRHLATNVRRSIAQMWEECGTNNKTAPTSPPPSSVSTAAADPAIADLHSFTDRGIVTLHRGHDLTVTAVALHAGGSPTGGSSSTTAVAYSGSKDHSIYSWDVERAARVSTICPQWKKAQQRGGGDDKSSQHHHVGRADGQVLALACSDDGRYLASGHYDATVRIYDVRLAASSSSGTTARSSSVVTTFRGHKGPVTSLTFRPHTLQLFSGSDDRCIRHHNLDEMTYVETLYGHQSGVTAISCPRAECPVSAGRDRTVRGWKLSEETHTIHRAGGRTSHADCLDVVNDDAFVTGHDDGRLNLWNVGKKRPVRSLEGVHGFNVTTTTTPLPRGICSVNVLRGSDVAVTGSDDGYVRFWNVSRTDDEHDKDDKDSSGLEPLGKVPLRGYVNDLALGPGARFCVAAVGQEPRLGRWGRVPGAKNRFAIVRLRKEGDEGGEDEEEEDEEEDCGEEE